MRTLLGLGLALGLACAATAADEKIDAKKLVGKWELTAADIPKGASMTTEFAGKGKLLLSVDLGNNKQKIEGTYKVEGDKLEMVMAFGGKEKKETVTITKLTDEELILKDTKGKEDKFRKVKAKN